MPSARDRQIAEFYARERARAAEQNERERCVEWDCAEMGHLMTFSARRCEVCGEAIPSPMTDASQPTAFGRGNPLCSCGHRKTMHSDGWCYGHQCGCRGFRTQARG